MKVSKHDVRKHEAKVIRSRPSYHLFSEIVDRACLPHVVRFENEQVFQSPEGVLAEIKKYFRCELFKRKLKCQLAHIEKIQLCVRQSFQLAQEGSGHQSSLPRTREGAVSLRTAEGCDSVERSR